MGSRPLFIGLVLAVAGGAVAAAVTAASYTGSPITVNDATPTSVGTATVYPAVINVQGEPTLVTDVNVKFAGFQHGFSDDFDVLLQSPSGAAVIVMSDSGDGNPVGHRTYAFDDSAASALPDESPAPSGTYRPTNHGRSAAPLCENEPDPDFFPAPAPAPPASGYPSTLSAFNGTAANGDWKLYVVDDCVADTAAVTAGWSITLSAVPTAVVVRGLTGRAVSRAVEIRWRTASEANLSGFNLIRTGAGATSRANPRPIRAKHAGTTRGGSYRFVDRHVVSGVSYTYRLELVRLNGSRVSAGAVALRVR
jgi:subtilisin-like proprotein convertase family protein